MKTTLATLLVLTVAGCSSGSAPPEDHDGAVEDGHPSDAKPSDARPSDAHSKDGATHDGAHDGGIRDGTTDGPPSMTDAGGIQCFETFSAPDICGYSSSNAPDYMCPGGFSPGTCPTSGLFGCCIDREVDGGVTSVGAICYYSPDSGTNAMAVCESKSGEVWSTSGP